MSSYFTSKVALIYCRAVSWKEWHPNIALSLALILTISSFPDHFIALRCIYLFNSILYSKHFATIPPVEQQRNLQSWRREDWVRHTGNKVTNLLEQIFLQDLPRNEGWPAAQLYCHKYAGQFFVFVDRWRAISKDLTGSWWVEKATRVWRIFAAEL